MTVYPTADSNGDVTPIGRFSFCVQKKKEKERESETGNDRHLSFR